MEVLFYKSKQKQATNQIAITPKTPSTNQTSNPSRSTRSKTTNQTKNAKKKKNAKKRRYTYSDENDDSTASQTFQQRDDTCIFQAMEEYWPLTYWEYW